MIKKRTARIISLTTIMVLVAMLVAFFAFTIATNAAPAPGVSYIERQPAGLAYFHPNKLSCQRVNGKCSITIT